MTKQKIKIKKSKIGAVLLAGLFGLLFFILVLRISYIMITGHSNGQDLVMKADEKYLVKNAQQPERGKIYNRNGKVLVEDVERYKLVAVIDKKASANSKKPRYVVDRKEAAEKLSTVINMKPEEIKKGLSQKKVFQIEFGRKRTNLTCQGKLKIEKMNSLGISLLPETRHFYPNGNFASHLIGRAQKNPDTGELEGTLGVEKISDSYLSGSKESLKYIHDIWGYVAPNTRKEKQPKRGDDVYLTIDSDVQVFVEEALDGMVGRYQPKDLSAVVIDAKTGEILAYGQRPTFNPETGKDFGKKWANDLCQNTYEPGSTFKSYGLVAAIQEGAFNPDKKYKPEHRGIMGSRISNWDRVGWDEIPMSLGFIYSFNTLMMHLQDLVGADKMKPWYEQFGFGESTKGVFGGETPGQVGWSNELQQKTSSSSQSITVTPIQMLQAQSAFFNDGSMLKPWFVNSAEDPVSKRQFYKGQKQVAGKPITKDTAEKIEKQLDLVVNNKKSHAANCRVDGYKVEGKTGTAQVTAPSGGGYVKGPNPYLVSFMGDMPKKNPKVIIYAGMSLVQKNDQGAYELGVSKASRPITENTLKYSNIGKSKDGTSNAEYSKVSDVEGQDKQKTIDNVNARSLEPVTIGSGTQIKVQSIKAGNKILPHSRVLLLIDGDLAIPDMSGWAREDVIASENLTNIEVNLKGSGFVSHQPINKGQRLTERDKIDVEFSSENVDSDSTNNSDSNSDDKKKSDSETDKDKSD